MTWAWAVGAVATLKLQMYPLPGLFVITHCVLRLFYCPFYCLSFSVLNLRKRRKKARIVNSKRMVEGRKWCESKSLSAFSPLPVLLPLPAKKFNWIYQTMIRKEREKSACNCLLLLLVNSLETTATTAKWRPDAGDWILWTQIGKKVTVEDITELRQSRQRTTTRQYGGEKKLDIQKALKEDCKTRKTNSSHFNCHH